MSIGERLTQLRKRNGLSQEELAEKLGLTRQTISKWELNQSSPDIEYVIALCDCFDVSSDYLLRGVESELKKENTETDSQTVSIPDNVQDRKKGAFSMMFFLGLTFTVLSCGWLLALFVMSMIQPWSTQTPDGKIYEGFWGYVLAHNAQVTVCLLLAFLICGIGLSVFGVIKKLKAK